ncbi:hypothetical protein ACS0TY_000879 [Phlomoides rotata]
MGEQGQQKVACSDAKLKMNAIDNELSKIVGLDTLKMQLRKWLKGMVLDERRRAFGLITGPRKLPQFAFLGNPGTGKTMVARILSKLLHMVGILAQDRVIEVQRTDLVAQYIGQTGIQTRDKIKEAEGGILFVDEAYRLVPGGETSKDFGLEAIEEIMCFMDSGKAVVIFAGYTEPMKRVISSNEGIRSRVSNIFHFDDFTCEQLANILRLKLPNKDENSPFYGFKLDGRGTSVKDVAALIKRGTSGEQRRKMNGGLVDQMLLLKARENLDSRTDVECSDISSIVAITSEDLAVGLWLLRDEE